VNTNTNSETQKIGKYHQLTITVESYYNEVPCKLIR